MSERVPAETFGIGEFIQEEMDERGWSDQYMTTELRWVPSLFRAVKQGRYPVNERVACDLARVFGTSVDFWLNLGKRGNP